VDVAEWLPITVDVAFALPLCTPDATIDGCVIDGLAPGVLVHAATVAETRTVKAAQLTAVSVPLAAVPAAIKRTFMMPPYMPGGAAI
jgi:hypothetical protein